jgi:hypothetical protein
LPGGGHFLPHAWVSRTQVAADDVLDAYVLTFNAYRTPLARPVVAASASA